MAESDAVLEICDSDRIRPVKKNNNNNKDSTEIRKTIKIPKNSESFNKKDSTETRKIIKDSEEFGIF